MSAPNRIIAISALLMVAGCSQSSTSPHQGTYVTVVSGGGQRDTIFTTLPQPLTVRVAGTSSVAGRIVQFVGAGPVHEGIGCDFNLTTPTSAPNNCVLTVTSDVNGEASITVQLLDVAGQFAIGVKVLDDTGAAAGSTDSVRFTIAPGHAVSLEVSPADTAMYVGATLTLHAAAVDRAANVTADSITYGPTSGPIAVTAGRIFANGTGRASVVIRGAGFADTTRVSVVPRGTIAMGFQDVRYLGCEILDLDGSGFQLLDGGAVQVLRPSWSPNGQWIAFQTQTQPGISASRIAVMDTTGKQWLADTTALQAGDVEVGPQYSRDGRWLYFTRSNGSTAPYYAHIWRVGADSAAAPVPNQAPAWDYDPSPSPDGSQVAYVSAAEGGVAATLKILNVTTGAVTSTGVTAQTPRWSPQGQTIAYIAGAPYDLTGPLSVVQADGSNAHVIGPPGSYYYFSFDWSPDGQWIVAVNGQTNHVDVINVASGIALPLAFTRANYAPTWRPSP